MKTTTASPATGMLYWYMTPGIVAESDLAGAIKSEYVFFGGERVARRDTNSGVFYYFSDHLKTASMETDVSGNIKDESDFYPWGGELQFSNSNDNHYKFTGKERDAESGLDYFGVRYYSNGLGRWASPDPKQLSKKHLFSPQRWNKYSYVQNDPLGRIDPDGLEDFIVFRPTTNATSKSWSDAKIAVEKNPSNHVKILNGGEATVKAWNTARTTPGTTAIFVGHTTHEMNGSNIGTTNAISLNDGRSAGENGYQSTHVTPAATHGEPPTVTMDSSMVIAPGATQADTVAIFGCQSIDLSSQYGNTNFVGIESGTDKLSSLEASDEAGAAFVAAHGTGHDGVQSANGAFQQNARVSADVNDKDGDKVTEQDKKKPE
jgi:RHS repeat-associated protein